MVTVDLPPYAIGFGEHHRYKVLYGGRGGAKSWTVARILLMATAHEKKRVLCTREYQVSIADSVHKLLCDQIAALGLSEFYSITTNGIVGRNGSEFLFSGLKTNPTKIQSLEGIDIAWVEEAQRVSNVSWDILIPTIRKEGSEIWVTFNPDREHDPTYQRFLVRAPPGALVRKVSWRDNPWMSQTLMAEKDYAAKVDPDGYNHVWEGGCRVSSAAQVLSGKYRIEEFSPAAGWDGPYYGADWGFARDPTALVRCWIHDRVLYIEHEAWGIGVDIDATPKLFDDSVPACREYVSRADSARPETISYMRQHGFPQMTAAVKWAGSVEDGVAFLRSHESIVIHPRCRHTAEEAHRWSYKTDALTGDVLPVLVDADNHCWDAVRYALQPLIKQGASMGLLEFYRQKSEQMKAEQEKHAARA